jgi:hypothetical protein
MLSRNVGKGLPFDAACYLEEHRYLIHRAGSLKSRIFRDNLVKYVPEEIYVIVQCKLSIVSSLNDEVPPLDFGLSFVETEIRATVHSERPDTRRYFLSVDSSAVKDENHTECIFKLSIF